MFDFSFGELAVVVTVALVVVGPKDLPVVMRTLGKWAGKCKGITDEFTTGFKSAMQDTPYGDIAKDVHEIHQEVQFIRDESGQLQQVYDISDFLDEEERKRLRKPSA